MYVYHQRDLGKTLDGDPCELLAELWGLGQVSRAVKAHGSVFAGCGQVKATVLYRPCKTHKKPKSKVPGE